MPNSLMLILPLSAIAFLGYMLLPLIYALFKPTRLNQTTWGDGKSIRKAAFDRGQGDEYETLLALGFIPLGTYQESIWRVFDGTEQYVFTHRELPIVCSLCQNVNQELYVVLTTDDSNGRYVRTSSSANGVQLDTRDCFAHCVEAETFEQVFVAHVGVLDQWEQIGFQPTRSETLEEVKLHYQRTFQNPTMQQLMCKSHAGLLSAFLTVGVMLPGCLMVVATQFLAIFQINWSFGIVAQVMATASLAGTCHLFRKLDFSKVAVKNSIGGPQNTLPAQPKPTESTNEPVLAESLLQQNAAQSQQWSLPFRDGDGAKGPAALVIMFVVGVLVVFCGFAGMVFQASPVAGVVLLTALISIAAGLTAWAIAITLGRSWHQIEIDENYIQSTEKAWWFWLTRKRPVAKIKSVKLDPMHRHPDIALGIFHREGAQASHVIAVCFENTSEFRVAFAYSKEVLVPLAFELAEALGLPASSVMIRNEQTASERHASVPLEEKILEDSQHIASEMKAALNVRHATPTAHVNESFELTNAAWKRGRGMFFALIGSVLAMAAVALWLNGESQVYLIFIIVITCRLFRIRQLHKLLPFRTIAKVALDHISLTRQTLIQNDSVVVDGHNYFHFQDVIALELVDIRAGGKAFVAYLSGKQKVILADSGLGFSPTDVEALATCSQAKLLSYQQAKRVSKAGNSFQKKQSTVAK